jgi:subtilisin family serine protease
LYLKHNHEKLLLAILLALIVLFSTQSAGASSLPDGVMLLRSKSDPTLRTFLAGNVQGIQEPVSVIVVFSEIPNQAGLQIIDSIGRIRTFTGHVATMEVSPSSLQQLARVSFVARISSPKQLKPQAELKVTESLLNRFRSAAEDLHGNAINGSDVIIGIADTGIDYAHKDFYFGNGTNKIIYIWDQSSDGIHPVGFGYGNECGPTDIQMKTCSEVDSSLGHGTAVAAVAASTGQAPGNYLGVAPGASLIAVKLKQGTEDFEIDAFSYLIGKARELGLPLVIDFSYGDSLGSHDGTEPLELAMTDFAAEGVPIVVAAGNSRNADLHVSGRLSPEQAVSVSWILDPETTISTTDIWYSVSDTLSISVKTPSGETISGPTLDAGIDTPDGNIAIQSGERSTGREWWIQITAAYGRTLQQSPWMFTLTGAIVANGKWNAWTEPGQYVNNEDSISGRYLIDPSDTIDHPGTATGVITVGSYLSRVLWYSYCSKCVKGQRWGELPAPALGDLEAGSGAGPTRDGRMKPELTAPGANIIAARANTSPVNMCQFNNARVACDPDDYHQIWRGTSFAAANVTGVIALMLQVNPYLSPNEIKNILTHDATRDTFTGIIGEAGSPLWGWGKVNALTSILDAPKLYSVKVELLPTIGNAQTIITLDGHNVAPVPLNATHVLILELKRDGTHTIELSTVIQVRDGARYVVNGTPWQVSSGGSRVFQYRLQYLLVVNSQYGVAAGGGWYDANSTATVSVDPTEVSGHRFGGWSGSANSESPIAELRMDSPKQVTAEWVTEFPTLPQINIEIVLVLVAIISVALVSVLRAKGHLWKHSLRARSTLQCLYGL